MVFMSEILKEKYKERFNEDDYVKTLDPNNLKAASKIADDMIFQVIHQKFHDDEWQAKAYVILCKVSFKEISDKYPEFNDMSKYIDLSLDDIIKAAANDFINMVDTVFNDLQIILGGRK